MIFEYTKLKPLKQRKWNWWNDPINKIQTHIRTDSTLISPSADPVAKYSSCGSNAIHLTALSCATYLCLITFDLISIMHTSPRFPVEIIIWCWGANTKLLDPWSWHVKATTKALPCGSIESQIATFLLSELWPAEKKNFNDGAYNLFPLFTCGQ